MASIMCTSLCGRETFSDGKNSFTSRQGDLAIWQMSNTIQRIECSDDFEADVLLLSGQFLQQFNPEMVWASKGFVFIRINPSFHLDEEALRLMDEDFEQFRKRLLMEDSGFKREILGRVMQIFIYDLWTVCYCSYIPAIPCTGSAECQDRARSGFLCRSALHHPQVSVTGEPHYHGTACIRVDPVLCIV